MSVEQSLYAARSLASLNTDEVAETFLEASAHGEFSSALRFVEESTANANPKGFFIATGFELGVILSEREATLTIDFDERLLDGRRAKEIIDQWRLVVEAMTTGAPCVWQAAVVSGPYAIRALRDWNAVEAPLDRHLTLHGMVERWSGSHPDAVALITTERLLTYAQLDSEANQLAHELLRLGVCGGDRVGLCTRKGAQSITAMLAVMKVGAAYVPIDPDYPEARVDFMINDARIKVLMIWHAPIHAAALHGIPVVDLEMDELRLRTHPSTSPRVSVGSDAFCYVIYTSGSSGQPKGVMLDHLGRVNNIADYVRRLSLSPQDRVLCVSSLSFDISVCNIFTMFHAGGAVVLPDPSRSKDPDHWLELLGIHGVTFWHSAPALLDALLESTDESAYRNDSLRRVLVGGDWVPLTQPGRLRKAFPHASFATAGGATELSIDSTFYAVDDVSPEWSSIPYGRPMDNQVALILSHDLAIVPVGVPGELHLGGVGVAAGYFDRPALTADRFIPHPWPSSPGERLYRTGDLAKYGQDGTIELLGRMDFQVKVAGVRVELGEVEAVVLRHDAVISCVAAAQRHENGRTYLACYVVAEPLADVIVLPDLLREWAKARLPSHAVPEAYIVLDRIPLTPNGKVDRRNLPMEVARTPESHAPVGETEVALHQIWASLLRRDSIGRHERFFEAGGYSLHAVRLLARVRESFGVDLPLASLFESPSLSSMAASIRHEVAEAKPIRDRPLLAKQELPLRRLRASFSQERLWFLSRLDDALSVAYHIPYRVRLKGHLQEAPLRKALDFVWNRHDSIRATFRDTEHGVVIDELPKDIGFPLEVFDFRGMPDAMLRADEQLSRSTHAPFDLSTVAPVRAILVKVTDELTEFLVVHHHIVSDGWSLAIFLGELNELYSDERFDDARPSLPLQYADYAHWQRQHFTSEHLSPEVAYWRSALQGVTTSLALPTDRRRRLRPSFAADVVDLDLGPELTASLRKFGAAHSTTVFTILLTAWAIVLSRLSGQEDIVIGVPAANRGEPSTESMVGYFVNTLPLRADLSGDPSVATLIHRMTRRCIEAQQHQDLPLGTIIEMVNPQRSIEHMPLFQVAFAWQNHEEVELSFDGVETIPLTCETRMGKFDLELSLRDRNGSIGGSLRFLESLFDRATAIRHRGYFIEALRAMLQEAEAPLREIDVIPRSEREAQLESARAIVDAYDDGSCLHHPFERHARAKPDAPALCMDGVTVTYGQLNDRATRLAWLLAEKGVGPGQRVAIVMEKNFALIVAMLATLKVGAAYVPVDATYPVDRIHFILSDCDPAMVICHEEPASISNDALPAVVVLDRDGFFDGHTIPRASDLRGVAAKDAAYLIYTSGSTGTPKAVIVEHANACRLFSSTAPLFEFALTDTWTMFHTHAFDFSVWEIWGALSFGARLVIVPPSVARSPEKFHALLAREGVTVLNQTPTAFAALDEIDAESSVPLALRLVIFGGESLNASALREWMARHGDHHPRMINMYGITETTVHVTYRPLTRRDASGDEGSLIGRPLPDLSVYLLGSRGELLPFGATGEMYVGGAGVARGYFDRDALTAERFVDNPWVPGQRLYRTGDLARLRTGGDIEYLGRADHQVKVRGYRIEPAEVETALMQASGVAAATVIATRSVTGTMQLVAYVVRRRNDKTSPSVPDGAWSEELRRFAIARLPEHMVPAFIVALDVLPRTSNGKVDLDALPLPSTQAVDRTFSPPRNELEERLCEAWSVALRQARVGIQDNYFSLGGDSILSIRLIALLRSWGISLELRDLYEYQTIEELAAHVVRQERPAGADDIGPFALLTLDEADEFATLYEDAYPMSLLQEGMIFHSHIENFNGIYHDLMSDCIRAAWREDLFLRSVENRFRQNPLLRTGFRLGGKRPIQFVRKPRAVQLGIDDLRSLPKDEQDAHVRGWMEQRKRHTFDWQSEDLLAFHVFLREDEMFECMISFHHSILDGWSVACLKSDLYMDYADYLAGRTVRQGPVDHTYRHFIRMEELAAKDEVSRHYFRHLLQDLPAPQLPRSHPATAGGTRIRCDVPAFADLAPKLQSVATRLGVPFRAILLAAQFRALAMVTGLNRVSACVVHHGRPETEQGERALGLFLNALPMVMSPTRGTWRELIDAACASLNEVLRHRRYPAALIAKDLGNPLSEIVFNYTHFHAYNDLGSDSASELRILSSSGFEHTNFAFSVNVSREPSGDGAQCWIDLDVSRFDENSAVAWMQHFIRGCLGIVNDVEAPLQNVVHPAGDGDDSAVPSTPATRPPETALTAYAMFQANASLNPKSIAIESDGEVLTYAEMDMKADRLASHLVQAGLRPEYVVGICTASPVAFATALVAVAKAGGTSLPIDSGYPAERIDFLLSDANPVVLLVDDAGRPALKGVSTPVMMIGIDAWNGHAFVDMAEPGTALSVRQLAYIIYTSGSTGKPKGVMVEHGGLANLSRWHGHTFGIHAGTRVAAMAPVGFDASIWEIWGCLANGGTLVMPPAAYQGNPDQLLAWIGQQEVDLMFLVTPLAVEALEGGALPERLRSLLIGGDAIKRIPSQASHLILVNNYGPTETTVVCTSGVLRDDDPALHIGMAIDGASIYLLDEFGDPVRRGDIGEIVVGGAGVSRGYLKRPSLTASRFRPDPFATEPGSRMYHTGDLGRILPTGRIEFIGRQDDQIKIRGYRVEPSEVASCLIASPDVLDAVVVGQDDGSGNNRLVAYIIPNRPRPGSDTNWHEALASYLASRLPSHLVPSAFVSIERVPRTAQGKLDRGALPPASGGTMTRPPYVQPEGEFTVAVARIWEECLGVANIGAADNFFLLGGHSLVALRMRSRLESELGVSVPLSMLFEAPQLEAFVRRTLMASIVEELGHELSAEDVIGMQSIEGTAP
ncbi:non-ribosomal peptide synthetase [Luteibacter sp. ME-Dv--P-043b]|uniref:non-ribosomal peptide synthetase n=1 Tax=Luteibacter sp. ME-Dv--P-043b TaxID=3040291 RepID=UPI002554D9E7|nr:non-ribosomal peptide synthetase [Luteibacter sp. ME-Dv--P-043b]